MNFKLQELTKSITWCLLHNLQRVVVDDDNDDDGDGGGDGDDDVSTYHSSNN
jgi:hypothetical protein